MASLKRKMFLASAVLTALLLVTAHVYVTTPAAPPPRPMPATNGYHDFEQAVQVMVEHDRAMDLIGWKLEEHRAYISSNAATLKLLRTGLSRECMVPIDFADTNWPGRIEATKNVRRLGWLFQREAILAELEYRTNAAAASYLDMLRFSRRVSQGGLLLDRLGASTLERTAATRAAKLAPGLSAMKCRELIHEVEQLDQDFEPWETTLDNEKLLSECTESWTDQLRSRISDWKHDTHNKIHTMVLDARKATRHLLLTLAAHAYELEKGHPPKSTADLFPDYLRSLPKDPATGQPLSIP